MCINFRAVLRVNNSLIRHVQACSLLASRLTIVSLDLRSWASNSPKLPVVVQNEKVADANQVVNLLGLHWDTSTD